VHFAAGDISQKNFFLSTRFFNENSLSVIFLWSTGGSRQLQNSLDLCFINDPSSSDLLSTHDASANHGRESSHRYTQTFRSFVCTNNSHALIIGKIVAPA